MWGFLIIREGFLMRFRVYYLLIPLILLYSCVPIPRVDNNLLAEFNIGDRKQDVLLHMVAEPEFAYNFKSTGNVPVEVCLYKRPIYEKKNFILPSLVYDYCMFSFVNSELVYWGPIDDFKRSSDTMIRDIGEKAAKLLNMEKDK
jgi:hypothetical protein